ncbi:hypothetical protein [Novosphingobium sp. ZW T3_23]|uniref:hypothetical protein n=1 Tax=Novosphingobium sp. ZW T3_23 TaxID=3378084 RepID=UPI0038541BB9
MTFFRNTAIATALAATALASATPAMARDHYRNNDNTAAVAIGAGVIGVALGAILASNNNRDRDRYRDDRYYGSSYGSAYNSSWQYRDGGRHSRDDYDRYQRGDYRRGYDRDRGDFRRGY